MVHKRISTCIFPECDQRFAPSATIVVLRRRPPLPFAVLEPEGERRVRLMAQPSLPSPPRTDLSMKLRQAFPSTRMD